MDPQLAGALLEAAPVGLMVIDAVGTITWVSPSVYDLTGYGTDDVVGTNFLSYLHESAVAGLLESVAYVQEHTDAVMGPASLAFRHADGELRVLEASATNRFDHPAIGGLVVAVRDITFQWRLNEALGGYSQGAGLPEVLRTLCAALLGLPVHGRAAILDAATGTPLAAVQLPLEVLGAAPTGAPPRPWQVAVASGAPCTPGDLSGADDDLAAAAAEHGIATLWAVPIVVADEGEPGPGAGPLGEGVQGDGPHGDRAAGERVRGCLVVATSVPGEPSVNERYTLDAVARNAAFVIEREQLLGRLRRAARTDALTGLANRADLLDRDLDGAAVTRRSGPVAVLYVDLDGFKPVNDRLGHAAGDAVLVEVARRLRQVCRDGDELGRLGGDEFALLCWDVVDPSVATAIADRVLGALAVPIEVDGPDGPVEVLVGASVGVALSTPADVDLDATVRRADDALYEAKRAGRGGWSLAP